MQCDYFDAAACRSCTLMGTPYDTQLADKAAQVRAVLADVTSRARWHEPYPSEESGFRNKAKLAIGGTVESPTLGILDASGVGVDLRDCGLYVPALAAAIPRLAQFVTEAQLSPYDLATRRGELKYLLITSAPNGELMIRFVLRSREAQTRITKYVGALIADLPQVRSLSINLQPEHKAVLEGDVEIPIIGDDVLIMSVNEIPLYLRSRSFFQTNTAVSAALYRQAQDWIAPLDVSSLWDLYCGVGGFALHLASAGRTVVGVESSSEAIASARLSAAAINQPVEFLAQDAAAFAARHTAPDLVVVNPPRRGIGDLAVLLNDSDARWVLYSSCNATSLARDLAAMPSFEVTDARLFDMFPQTAHHEVLCLLRRA